MREQEGPILFGPFRLDRPQRLLWCGDSSVLLRPKTIEVLVELLQHRGQVVSKEHLLKVVWEGRAVSEYVLTTCISELRAALRDDAKQARYLKTVHRSGYQLTVELGVGEEIPRAFGAGPFGKGGAHLPPVAEELGHLGSPVVGREAELARLRRAAAAATDGRRQVVFITGEMGIGKTTLIDRLVEELSGDTNAMVARGQCIEQFGAGEPYMPVFEAIGRLAREVDAALVIEVLRQRAPTWLVQIPGLLPPEQRAELRRELPPETQAHMLRLIADGIEALCERRLLVLLLEDLHLSDHATLELIGALALRRGPAKLLLVATFRDAESFEATLPFRTLQRGLLLHRQCEEIALYPLRREAIDVYLAQRFAGLALPAGFAELVYARTEGNPLFVARLVDHLLEDGLLVVDANAGELQQTADIAEHVPPTLRATIEQRADAFTPAEREVLEAASVAGVQFWSAGVAAALGLDREEVERHCSALCRRHGFLAVHDDEGVGLPQLGGRYCFRHSLYRQALYDRIEVSRRQRWHRAIAEALRAGWQGRAGEIAAELASHFERGAAYADAIELYDRAAATAAGRGANREAVLHLDRALMLLSLSADDGNRAQRRLDILMSRGPLVLAAAGHGSQEVLDNYRPALELARQLDNSMRELACLGALAVCEQTRGNLAASEQLALAMTAVAERIGFPEPILAQLRNPLSQVRLYQGKLAEALALSDAAIAAYEVFTLPAPAADDRPALWADLGVMLYSQRAAASFASGLLRQAGEAVERAMAMARELRHPFNLAYAATWAAAYESTMGRWQEAIARADEAIDVADNYDFPFWGGVARIFRGHARAQIGYIEEGLAELRHGLDLWSGTGAKIATTMYCNLHAEACLLAGDIEGARAGLDRGAAYAEETDEHVFAAETLRLGAECRRRAGAPKKEVAAILQQALELSRQQGTRLWQLRAALDLHRLQPTAATQQAVATAAAHLQSEPIPHPLPF